MGYIREMPNVDVIIPTCNRAEFLHSAIASVLNQTFQDFEIIVVDDASKDNTQNVVRSFSDKRIKYMRHEISKGVSAARNTGIKASSSDYIAFLDDDDEWLPEKLERQINLLENNPTSVGGVYTGTLCIDKTNGRLLRILIPEKRGRLFKEFLNGNFFMTPSLLLRKECFKKVGLFDEDMAFSEDYDMWIRISKEFHFEYIKEPLVKCYIHENRLSTNLEAQIRGIETMFKKYGQLFALDKKSYSRRYLALGVLYCFNNNTKKGRESLLKAIKLYPFGIKYYFNLGLSLLGTSTFKKLKKIKEKVVAPLRSGGVQLR